MQDSEAKIIAEGMVQAAERSGDRIARGMVKSAEKSAERIANAIVDNNTKNAEALREGFRDVAKSLSGTKAELMMDVLLRRSEANGGDIPEPGSDEWNKCKQVATKVLKEFSDEA